MTDEQRLPILLICLLILVFVLGCGLVLTDPTPIVMTEEVTRLVVVTATFTHTPVIIERVITVTVVVAATPAIDTVAPEETLLAAVTQVATEQISGEETVTPIPDLVTPIPTPSPEMQPATVMDGLDDPATGLAALAEVAITLKSQGTHTLRLRIDLSVPIEVIVKRREQVDENLTRLVRRELSGYEIQGDYIVDISVDDLAQRKWVIDALGRVIGLASEEGIQLRQNENRVWEKPSGGEWSLRKLSPDETLFPLGNSLVTIDPYTHALNLSDLIVDALRPLLLAGHGEQPTKEQDYGWIAFTGDSSPDNSLLEMRRERILSSSNNLKTVAASLASSGLSEFADPAAVTNGIQQIISIEKAWLIPDTRLVNRGQVEIQGKGVVEVAYMMQQRLLDATVIVKTDNTFEHLSFTTVVTAPE